MLLEIKVPTVGESISEVTISNWLVKNGDYVKQDQVLCEMESDKATFELNAEQAGTITILIEAGSDAAIGDAVHRADHQNAVKGALLLGGLGGEDEGYAVVAQLGLELEEGFIDRPQLLRLHRAPVDRDHTRFVAEP